MSVVPTGNPAWVRTAAFTTYGGDTNKRNHLSKGVIDPETDVGAEEFSRMVEDLAAAVRVIPFCTIRYTCNDTSPAAPTVHVVQIQTSSPQLVDYAGDNPPSGMPTLTRNGDGDVTITLSATYADAYGVSGAMVIRAATGGLVGTSAGTLPVELTGDSTARARAFDDAGAAVADARGMVQLW